MVRHGPRAAHGPDDSPRSLSHCPLVQVTEVLHTANRGRRGAALHRHVIFHLERSGRPVRATIASPAT
jgi:hypothetical protein